MNEKVIGYTLLAIGVLVIIFAGVNVLMVFTKNAQPIQLFNFPGVSLDTSSLIPGLPKGTSGPKAEIFPAEVLNQSSNVFAHLFLMGFIASLGGRVATLGVMLLRPVEVKVRTKEVPVEKQ